jgi:hypothetical protein
MRVTVAKGRKFPSGRNTTSSGPATDQLPGGAGDSLGIGTPAASGPEKRTVTSDSYPTLWEPDDGEIDTTRSGGGGGVRFGVVVPDVDR